MADRYETIPVQVEAFQAPMTMNVFVEEGANAVQHVRKGQWVVLFWQPRHPEKVAEVLDDADFQKKYRKVQTVSIRNLQEEVAFPPYQKLPSRGS